jgi:hypothetical protein
MCRWLEEPRRDARGRVRDVDDERRDVARRFGLDRRAVRVGCRGDRSGAEADERDGADEQQRSEDRERDGEAAA